LWQAVLRTIVGKRVSVEPRQTVSRAEPEEAVRVVHDLIDDVMRQTIGGRVSLEWQTLARDRARNAKDDNQYEKYSAVFVPILHGVDSKIPSTSELRESKRTVEGSRMSSDYILELF
jgi:hypothetical protein